MNGTKKTETRSNRRPAPRHAPKTKPATLKVLSDRTSDMATLGAMLEQIRRGDG